MSTFRCIDISPFLARRLARESD